MKKGVQHTITYFAKNLETGTRYSGDSGNHTCMISKDGGGFSLASNRPTDIGNGLYALKLTATETDCDFFTLYVGSSTTNIFIEPVRLTFNDPEQFKADVSGLATSSQVEALQTSVNAIPTEGVDVSGLESKLEKVLALIANWTVEENVLTAKSENGTTLGTFNLLKDEDENIVGVEPIL